jgi:hypothetical protein
MAKWVKGDLFNKFAETKQEEQEKQPLSRKSDIVWESPKKGTSKVPAVYEVRLLPDPDDEFYKKYHYHMFKSGDKWIFILCEKSFGFTNFCPWCSYASHLWSGTENDKKLAPQYGRKDRFVGNVYIVNDPRDVDRPVDKKVNGTVKLYEFPGKLDDKIRAEILNPNKEESYGEDIFNPGEEGVNFFIKIGATAPGKDGKEWPSYDLSTFARKRSALASSDAEIQKIMDSCHSIDKYIKSMRKTKEEHKALLDEELIFPTIEAEWNKHYKVKSTKEEDLPSFDVDPLPSVDEVTKATKEELDIDDAALLAELEKY